MKKALVTGSSRGIGRAIAISLAKDGFYVVVHSSGKNAKAEETLEIIRSNGGDGETVTADLCDTEETARLCETLKETDVLVCNASLQYRNPWRNITVDECREQLNCNFVSTFLLIQAVVPHMVASHWGRIVTIGSVQEAKPHPDMLIYSCSKAAQTGMVRSLAAQLGDCGITVNNVAPGVIATDRNAEALSNAEYAKAVTDSIPLGRIGTPDDVCGIVRFLCGNEAGYITGQSIFADGGKSL